MIKLIKHIEIETCNSCNKACPWCFYGVMEEFRKRKLEYLDTCYIKNVFNELKEHNYSGRIALFSINEPLLDERIRNGELIKLCKDILNDKVEILIITNGVLLTSEILFAMTKAGLDRIKISCYDDEIYEKACQLFLKHTTYLKFTIADFRKHDGLTSNRAGSLPLERAECLPIGSKYNQRNSFCTLPSISSIIGWDGEVRLCCNDVMGKLKFGNIKNQSYYDILNSDKKKEYTRMIITDRNKEDLPCIRCNYAGVHVPIYNAVEINNF